MYAKLLKSPMWKTAPLRERGSFLANQLLVELHVLLDAEGVLLLEGRQVTEGHQWASVPEVILTWIRRLVVLA